MADSFEKVCFDACIIIDTLEKRADRIPAIVPFIRDAENGKIKIVVSTLAIAETTKINGIPSDEQAKMIKEFFLNDYVYIHNADMTVALRAQELRRNHPLCGIDSIHIATALITGCTLLLTRDGKKQNKKCPILPLDKIIDPTLRILTPEDARTLGQGGLFAGPTI